MNRFISLNSIAVAFTLFAASPWQSALAMGKAGSHDDPTNGGRRVFISEAACGPNVTGLRELDNGIGTIVLAHREGNKLIFEEHLVANPVLCEKVTGSLSLSEDGRTPYLVKLAVDRVFYGNLSIGKATLTGNGLEDLEITETTSTGSKLYNDFYDGIEESISRSFVRSERKYGLATCIESKDVKICIGDTVYRGTDWPTGAEVVAINKVKQTVTAVENFWKNLYTIGLSEASVTQGCINDICVGDRVFKDAAYTNGAEVIAVNPSKATVLVVDNFFKSIKEENPSDLSKAD